MDLLGTPHESLADLSQISHRPLVNILQTLCGPLADLLGYSHEPLTDLSQTFHEFFQTSCRPLIDPS